MLILDEPTSGLDVLASRFLRDFVRAERDRGKAVLFSTHYLAEAELLCDRVGFLHHGRLLSQGTPGRDPRQRHHARGGVPGPGRLGEARRMNLRHVGLTFGKELREALRDRRTLAIMILLPLVVYPLLAMLAAQVATGREKQREERPSTVAVTGTGPARAPIEAQLGKHGSLFVLVSGGTAADVETRTRTFLAAHPSGLWGARGQYWLGQLLTVVPHVATVWGSAFYRGENYPKVAGAEKPVQVYLYQQDVDEAVAAFEKAKALYERLRPRSEEETDLNFDLARLLAPRDRMPMVKALFALENRKRPGLQMRFGAADSEGGGAPRQARLDAHPREALCPEAAPSATDSWGSTNRSSDWSRARAPRPRFACATWLANYQQEMQEWMRGETRRSRSGWSSPTLREDQRPRPAPVHRERLPAARAGPAGPVVGGTVAGGHAPSTCPP